MKKITCILILLVTGLVFVFGQTETEVVRVDFISIQKEFGSYKFYQNGKQLNMG